jgi:hypothetical protein
MRLRSVSGLSLKQLRERLREDEQLRGRIKELIRPWTEEEAQQLGESPEVIFVYWRRKLLWLGLIHAGGPKPKHGRCEVLSALMLEEQWNGSGRAPYGFDKRLGFRLGLTYRTAREWRVRHQEGCPKHSPEFSQTSTDSHVTR